MNLSPRAVIFDLYNTLVAVLPPPADASERWTRLWRQRGCSEAPLPLREFEARCQRAAAAAQARAESRGVAFPEVDWAEVACTASAELARLPDGELDEFLYQHARLQRTVGLMGGAAEVLATLAQRVPLGICSNCQPYSLHELTASLEAAGLSLTLFQPDLCFYSYAAGYRKPNPAAFAGLQRRLAVRGIAPGEVLMAGDRLDNDIAPAQAQGWQTWHLAAASPEAQGGDWAKLGACLKGIGGNRAPSLCASAAALLD